MGRERFLRTITASPQHQTVPAWATEWDRNYSTHTHKLSSLPQVCGGINESKKRQWLNTDDQLAQKPKKLIRRSCSNAPGSDETCFFLYNVGWFEPFPMEAVAPVVLHGGGTKDSRRYRGIRCECEWHSSREMCATGGGHSDRWRGMMPASRRSRARCSSCREKAEIDDRIPHVFDDDCQ